MLGGIVRGTTTTLRVPTEDDLVHVNAWMADMRVRRGGHLWDEPAMLETWKERLKEAAKDQRAILWTIEAEGRPVGTVRVGGGWESPGMDIHHFVIGSEFWGRGYGSDAALALHRYVFDYRDFRWTACDIPADNVAGLRVADKLGFREFGRGRAVYYRDGAYADQVSLRFDRETWDERWGGVEREYRTLPEGIVR